MIFVDAMAPCMRTKAWRHRENCHLFCDGDLRELHAFAVRLGLRLMWFQDKADLPHYDLTRNKRDLAVSLGAIEADRKTTGEWIRRWRQRRANPGSVICDVGVEVDGDGRVLSLRMRPKTQVPMYTVTTGQEYTLHVQGIGEVTAHVVGYKAGGDGMLTEISLTTAPEAPAANERSLL